MVCTLSPESALTYSTVSSLSVNVTAVKPPTLPSCHTVPAAEKADKPAARRRRGVRTFRHLAVRTCLSLCLVRVALLVALVILLVLFARAVLLGWC